MPRKGWRKPKDKPLWEFNLTFDDVTMAGCDGEYRLVKKLMDSDPALGAHKWTVRTRLHIVSQFGEGLMVLNFCHDKSVYIVDYLGPTNNAYQNPDIRCLSQWCQGSGWKAPEATADVIKGNVTFWRELWKSNIIDSEYLTTRFGARPFESPIEEEEEDYEEEEY